MLWKDFDSNGSGYVTLLEAQTAIRDTLALKEIFKCRLPVLKAFQATKKFTKL